LLLNLFSTLTILLPYSTIDSPTRVDGDNRNGVYYACIEGCLDVVKYLYKCRVELMPVMNINGFTPLHVCAMGAGRDHRNTGAWLMSRKGVDVEMWNL
jgi:ankyrin repeat protein